MTWVVVLKGGQEIYRHWIPVMAGGSWFSEPVGLLLVWWPNVVPGLGALGIT